MLQKEKRRSPPPRIESELDPRLFGIKTFETSTGQQDRLQLNHSSSRIFFRSFFPDPTYSPPSLSLSPLFSVTTRIVSASTSLLNPLHSAFNWTHRTHGAPPPNPSTASSGLVFFLSLLRYRVPILGPLGFTWCALMTSRNERIPPPSNKRLFHVPMLILRESSRLQVSLSPLLSSPRTPSTLLVSSYLTLHPLCVYTHTRARARTHTIPKLSHLITRYITQYCTQY